MKLIRNIFRLFRRKQKSSVVEINILHDGDYPYRFNMRRNVEVDEDQALLDVMSNYFD